MNQSNPSIAVAYLARGAGPDCFGAFSRFLASYQRLAAGVPHRLHILYKGFVDEVTLRQAQEMFFPIEHSHAFLDDSGLDIGAYMNWANGIEEEFICPLNTNTELLAEGWLRKLLANLLRPDVGCVGATGSYESSRALHASIPSFPNIHLRTNVIMMRRALFLALTEGVVIKDKLDARLFESGPDSLTRKLAARGLSVLVVGRNGRGYSPRFWPDSDTFRQGTQTNLLAADNQTRTFDAYPWEKKREVAGSTWGVYLTNRNLQILHDDR